MNHLSQQTINILINNPSILKEALTFLKSKNWYSVYKPANRRDQLLSALNVISYSYIP